MTKIKRAIIASIAFRSFDDSNTCLTEYASIKSAGSFPIELAIIKVIILALLIAAARLIIPEGTKGRILNIKIITKESNPWVF
jgi:hypothetical protein